MRDLDKLTPEQMTRQTNKRVKIFKLESHTSTEPKVQNRLMGANSWHFKRKNFSVLIQKAKLLLKEY